MFPGGLGLTEVSTADLRKALRSLHHGDLELPVTIAGLARVGLQHCSQPLLSHLRELNQEGVRAVLVGVLAERRQAELID
jgi:hypothetical protein